MRDALVLFTGEWCPDCRRFRPTWDDWVRDKAGRIYVVEVARGGPEWDRWGIDEIPTVAAYSKGAEVGRAHGEIRRADLDRLWAKLMRA